MIAFRDLGIVTFRERGVWIAAWTKVDFVAQGPTEKDALERLLMDIVVTALLDRNEGRPAFSKMSAPEPMLVQAWTRAAAAELAASGAPA